MNLRRVLKPVAAVLLTVGLVTTGVAGPADAGTTKADPHHPATPAGASSRRVATAGSGLPESVSFSGADSGSLLPIAKPAGTASPRRTPP